MTRLLVTGIPGTGKTCIGHHLDANYGLQHVDMEAAGVLDSFVQDRSKFLGALSSDAVITWGFHTNHLGDILFLKEQGWFLVWFDGDRPAALRTFIARGTVPQVAFYAQMHAIESQSVIARITPHASINPFREATFRPLDEIARELIRLSRGSGEV